MSVRDEVSTPDQYSCIGDVAVGFKGFQETFSTRIIADPEKRRIDVDLDRGPFRHLRNRWQFNEKSPGVTDVFFFIDYDFKNPLLRLLARTNQSLAINRIMQAFQTEADHRYRCSDEFKFVPGSYLGLLQSSQCAPRGVRSPRG